MKITIRQAQPHEAGKLTDIAVAAKRHWGYPEQWSALWLSVLTCTPEFIRNHPVYCAEIDGTVAAFYSLIETDRIWSFEDFWVLPSRMGLGVGRRLFHHAVDFIAHAGGDILRIVSDPNAEGFYTRMGAHRVGEVPSKPEGRRLPLLELRIAQGASNCTFTNGISV